MEGILEISKYIIPSLVVLLTVWIVLNHFFNNQKEQRLHERQLQSHKKTLPLRLQAYERIILFLERISFENLLIRKDQTHTTVQGFQQHLVSSIRSEYEHNISQQIYVSEEAWKVVRMTKENAIKLVNTASQSLDPDQAAIELSKTILQMQIQASASPTQIALGIIKAEARKLF